MPGRLFLPVEVVQSIVGHVREAVRRTIDDYPSVSEDEDTLLGHLGSKLKTGSQRVVVSDPELSGVWSWELDYIKFRGRGWGAAEKILGADGILTLSVDYGGRPQTKAALFQAKIEGVADRELVGQCAKLSNWREAAFVLNFAAHSIQAVDLESVFRAAIGRTRKLSGDDLAGFLANAFIPCLVGDLELNYDAVRKVLTWRSRSRNRSRLVATRFRVRHRLAIKARPLRRRSGPPTPLIEAEEIYQHRMDVDPREALSLPSGFTEKSVKAKRKALAGIYHPDRHMELKSEPELLELLERRTQEFNAWSDELLKP